MTGDGSRTSDIESIRRRPGMYVGATGPDGLHHMVDWVVDEFLHNVRAGRGSAITVVLGDRWCAIWDDQPPLPPGDGAPLLQLDASSDAFRSDPAARGMAPPVQTRDYLPVLRALSKELEVWFLLDGTCYSRTYRRGMSMEGAAHETGPPIDRRYPGMTFRALFWPDEDVFGDARIDAERLRGRLRVAAATCPDAKIRFCVGGSAPSDPPARTEEIRMPGGMADMLPEAHGERQHGIVPRTPFRLVVRAGEYAFDVALRWRTVPDPAPRLDRVSSWANTVGTSDGAHVLGLREAVRDAGLGDVAWDACLSVTVPQPRFSSAVKDVLHSPEIRRMVREHLTVALRRLQEDDDFAMEVARARPRSSGKSTGPGGEE